WFRVRPPGAEPPMRALEAAVLGAGPELQQVVKWGNLVFSTRGAHAFAIVPHKSQAHLQVFRGASLEQRFPQLEGSGRGLRHLKFRYGQPIDQELVRPGGQGALEPRHLPADVDDEAGEDPR